MREVFAMAASGFCRQGVRRTLAWSAMRSAMRVVGSRAPKKSATRWAVVCDRVTRTQSSASPTASASAETVISAE
jgi:hypothetical protein